MSHEVYDSEAAMRLAMTPEQQAIYDRGYRDTDLDSIVANDAMIECAVSMSEHAREERRKLLELGFRDSHPLCLHLNANDTEWTDIAYVQRRLDAQLRDT